MKIDTQVLQQIVDNNGNYLVGQRVDSFKESYAVFFSPNIEHSLIKAKVEELPYKIVDKFASSDVITNLFLGDYHPPFQWGIRYGEFINVEQVTCNSWELIIKCHQEKIRDYWEVTKLIKDLTKSNDTKSTK